MKRFSTMKHPRRALPLILVLALVVAGDLAEGRTSKARMKITREKRTVLDWLSRPETVEKFGRISDAIWEYAELGHQEFKSSKLLADTLEDAGFTLDRGLAGMPTCFVASYGSGKPVIGLLGEFDALPGLSQKGRVPKKEPVVEGAPGHGCGHNTMGTAAAAAAIAVKRAMDTHGIRGTIKVFGSPAEENNGSRPFMVRAGLFEGVDAVIDNHSGIDFFSLYGVDYAAIFSTVFTFKGQAAHAGSEPWAGRSALDAVEIMNVATNYLREHLPRFHRIHYVILDGGGAPNVVPDKASVWYFVRGTDEQIEDIYRRVVDCAKAAALATGVELASMRVLEAYHQVHANKAAAELFQKNIELVGIPAWSEEENAFFKDLQKEMKSDDSKVIQPSVWKQESLIPECNIMGGSSDVGEVSLIAPTAGIYFPGLAPAAINHNWSAVSSNYGSTAWKGLNAGAKAIAASAIDLLTQPKELAKLKKEFAEHSKTHPYKSFLPADATPSVDFYKELMDKYRPLLEKAFSEK